MHRIDNSNFLLYIEPKKEDKLKEPVIDKITKFMETIFASAQPGLANYSDLNSECVFDRVNYFYKGFHTTECGEHSSNQDYLLFNGMVTNSLCIFYLKYYRNSIPESEMDKVMKTIEDYINK